MVMVDEERTQPTSPDQPRPAPDGRDEAERLRRRWTLSPREWRQALDRHRAKEEHQAREIFGDRQPFPIPDVDSDT